MVLQRKWLLFRVKVIGSPFQPTGRSGQFDMVLNHNAIVENGQVNRGNQFTGIIKARRSVEDVIRLPLARGQAGIHQRWVLAVNGGGGTVRVGFGLEGIENLDFVAIQAKENAAVAAALTFAVSRGRSRPFNVKLA